MVWRTKKHAVIAALIVGGVWAVIVFGPLREGPWWLRFVVFPLVLAYLWATAPASR